jgi:hypothetical protein
MTEPAHHTGTAASPKADLRKLIERLWLAASDLRGFVDRAPYGSIQFHGTGKPVQETEGYRLAVEAIREAEVLLHGEAVTVPHPLRSTGATAEPS